MHELQKVIKRIVNNAYVQEEDLKILEVHYVKYKQYFDDELTNIFIDMLNKLRTLINLQKQVDNSDEKTRKKVCEQIANIIKELKNFLYTN